MLNVNISTLDTEQRNPESMKLDEMSSLEICELMNKMDYKVCDAVKNCLPKVAEAIDMCTETYLNGGRIIYIGAGSSGRYGVVDAVECPPTFGIPKGEFIGLMAGGMNAIWNMSENSEDREELAVEDLNSINFNSKDILIGTAASGRTPYVVKAMKIAKELGCKVICLSAVSNPFFAQFADLSIEFPSGPEVLTGSTRLKPATAQKMILNMISTGTMVKCGKVYQNLMVDVIQSNEKLVRRSLNIIKEATGCSEEVALSKLKESNGKCKVAIVSILLDCSIEEATKKLNENGGFVKRAIK